MSTAYNQQQTVGGLAQTLQSKLSTQDFAVVMQKAKGLEGAALPRLQIEGPHAHFFDGQIEVGAFDLNLESKTITVNHHNIQLRWAPY